MALYLNYSLNQSDAVENIIQNKILDNVSIDGIIFSEHDYKLISNSKVAKRNDKLALSMNSVREMGLKTGIKISCFLDEQIYSSETFSAPVAYSGAVFQPDSDYYPICPNNPVGLQKLFSMIDRYINRYSPDYLFLDHFQFPFNWKVEELDIQDKTPQYCYCPFCITEFSSLMGEIVTNGDQIESLIPEWLEWRTDSILNLIELVKDHVSEKTQLIIGLPPMAVIDLPFSTGLLPYTIIDEGIIVAPQLDQTRAKNKLLWIEDILDQYRIDLNLRKVWPWLSITNQNEFDYLYKFEKQYGSLIISLPTH